MRKAFTLVELLVVVAIIGLLASVLLVTFGSGTESARAIKCITGMRNLANGVTSYAMNNGHYPLAGSVERFDLDESDGVKNVKKRYNELPGWISWYSNNAYANKPTSHTASLSWFTSAYEQDNDKRLYCLTNGVLWKAVSENADIYVCPSHERKMGTTQRPFFSYMMNSYFGYDSTEGEGAKAHNYYGKEFGTLKRADRTLLFAELAWASDPDNLIPSPNFDDMPGTGNDCVLDYTNCDTANNHELIGFDHKEGKRWVAHVVYADGHTEKIFQPTLTAIDGETIKDLTELLCKGQDYSFTNGKYEELK